jgi:hypothetical protein
MTRVKEARDGCKQLVEVKWFGEDRVSGALRPELRGAARCCHHHDGDIVAPSLGVQPLANLNPAHYGHVYVQLHDSRRRPADLV